MQTIERLERTTMARAGETTPGIWDRQGRGLAWWWPGGCDQGQRWSTGNWESRDAVDDGLLKTRRTRRRRVERYGV